MGKNAHPRNWMIFFSHQVDRRKTAGSLALEEASTIRSDRPGVLFAPTSWRRNLHFT
jgi:hypothetical protein